MAGTLDLTGYKLTFDDEFNSFNTNVWKTNYRWADNNPSATINNELEYYASPDDQGTSGHALGINPFSAQGGALTITAAKTDPSVQPYLWNHPYTSGVITTEKSFSQEYGYFEMRAQMPVGKGLWPAFWMLASDGTYPPELDVVEQIMQQPTQLALTSHSGVGGTVTSDHHYATVPDTTQGYHTYGVKWDANNITWYFDGQQVAQGTTPSDFNRPMYLIANLAVGGNWPGSPDGSTPFPAHMNIDYIRAYSDDPSAAAVTPQSISAPDGASTPIAGIVTPSPSPAPVPAPAPAPAPTPTPVSSGQSTLVLHVAEDAYKGDAQFTVVVDGHQVGGTQTATASHAQGQWQDITLTGDFGAQGPNQVQVHFINDTYGGSASADRNLYVRGIDVNGHSFAGAAATNDANGGYHDPNAADMFGNGTVTFAVNHTAPPSDYWHA